MMLTAEYKQAECLLFVVADRKPGSPSTFSHTSANFSVKGYALLPQSFRTQEVVKLFSINDIRVITNAKDGFTLRPTSRDFTFEMFDIQLMCHESLNSESSHDSPNPLLIGVDEFNMQAVGSLLSKNVGIYRLLVKSRTVYNSTLNNRTLKTIKQFMSGGKDIACRHVKGGTILHFAVEKGKEYLVKLLLQCGADVNAKRLDGKTPLHIAAMNGWVKIAKTLLQHGADVNAKTEAEIENERGVTPLLCALESVHSQVLELLLEFGANVNIEFDYCPSTPSTLYLSSPEEQAKGTTKATILYTAALTEDFQSIKSILRYQPDINNECNRRAFHYVLLDLKDKSKDIFKQMEEYGFTIDCDRFGNSVKFLLGAIRINCFQAVQKTVEAGVNVSEVYETESLEKLKPLHMAASHAGRDIIQFLIDQGADLNAKLKGKFPIHCAVESSNISAVKCLIFNKANLLNIADLIICAKSAEMIEFLLMNGYPLTFNREYHVALEQAAHEGRIEVIEVLFKYGAHLSSECVDYRALLLKAIMRGHPKIFQAILDHIFIDVKMIKYAEVRFDFSKFFAKVPSPFFGPRLLKTCSNKLVQHFSKLKAASLCTFDENLSSLWFSMESIDDFQNRCEMEIAQMKSERVGGSEVSFYDILTQNLSQLTGYARNDCIVNTMKDGDYCTKFPVYSSILNYQFRKGLQREELLQKGIETCNYIFPKNRFYDLPDELKDKIINHLNNCDLLVLNNILATKTVSEG